MSLLCQDESLLNCDCRPYSQPRQRLLMLQNIFLLTNSSPSKRFVYKLRNYILLSNSFHIIRFSHSSIYIKNLANFIIDSSPMSVLKCDSHCFQLSCVSKVAGRGVFCVGSCPSDMTGGRLKTMLSFDNQ